MAFVSEFSCQLCTDAGHLKFDRRNFLKHLRLFHVHQPGFMVQCRVDGCPRTFTNLRTFENHLSSVHSRYIGSVTSGRPSEEERVNSQDEENRYDSSDDNSTNEQNNDNADWDADHNDGQYLNNTNRDDMHPNSTTEIPCSSQDLLKKSSILFLLSLKEKYKLTQAAIQGIIAGFADIAEQQLSSLKSQVYVLSLVWSFIL